MSPRRLTLIVAGRTAPNRAVRFGGEHDDLDPRGRRDIADLVMQVAPDQPVRSGPELSVRQSADILRPSVVATDPTLTSLGIGRWAGRIPTEIPPAELEQWFGDVESTPHGGESVAGFVTRIHAALDVVPDRTCLVVASPVAQAALTADPHGFFAVSVRPASVHVLHWRPFSKA